MSRSIVRLLMCLALCCAIAALASVVTTPEIPTWYAELDKPSWTPPDWAFPVAWSILYVLIAVALWRLWEQPSSPARGHALGFFLVQLALNAAWSPVFFALHAIEAALVVIVALVIALAGTVVTSARVDRLAALLLLPYLAWAAYAATVNAGVLAMN